MKRFLILASAASVLALVLAAGCSLGKGSSAMLDSNEWKVTTMNYGPYTGPIAMTSRFSHGTITGSTGLNIYRGTYRIGEDNSIAIKLGPVTKMTGTSEQTIAELEFLQALQSAAVYAVDGKSLTLFGSDGLSVLTYKAHVDAPLAGTLWRMRSFEDDKGHLVSLGESSTITLTFRNKGVMRGSAGLAGFAGKYSTNGDDITMTSIMLTKQTGAPNLLLQSGQFMTALKGARTFAIKGDNLTFRDAQGRIAAECIAE